MEDPVSGVNANDSIYRTNSGGAGWQQVPGLLKHVSADDFNTAWGVNPGDEIYRMAP